MKSGKRPLQKGCWSEISATVRGASHIKKDTPSQDALRVHHAENYLLVALSDGHGSNNCPYSDEGAAAAAETAVEVISAVFADGDALHTIKANKDIWLPKQLEKLWKAKVRAIHAEKKRDTEADFPYILYGATLLALVAADDFVFAVQLGDGDILMLWEAEAEAPESDQPLLPTLEEEWLIAPSELFLGNETDSLCQEASWQYVRTGLLTNPPEDVLFLLATDGYANSFYESAGFKQAGRDIYNMLNEQGADYIAENLENWLDVSSAEGSGDDISMSLVYREC